MDNCTGDFNYVDKILYHDQNCGDDGKERNNGLRLLIYRQLTKRRYFLNQFDDSDKLHPGCLWEEMIIIVDEQGQNPPKCCMVAPPYQCLHDSYSELLEKMFLNPTNFQMIIEEANVFHNGLIRQKGITINLMMTMKMMVKVEIVPIQNCGMSFHYVIPFQHQTLHQRDGYQ